MRWSQGVLRRVFLLTLGHGEILHEAVEAFARTKKIKAGLVFAVGAADRGSKFVVGPRRANERPIRPMQRKLINVHELAGVGTLYPDGNGIPILHMHASAGRGDTVKTGCIRRGVRVWHVMEIVIVEIKNAQGTRAHDSALGFSILKAGVVRYGKRRGRDCGLN